MNPKEAWGAIKNIALIGLITGLGASAVDKKAQSVSSQVPPSPEGYHQELKGPTPSQQPIAEQVRILASQGLTLQGQEGMRSPEQAEIKTDILITCIDFDSLGNPWVMARHPSKGDAQALYKGAYDQEKKNYTFSKLAEFAWKGTAALGGVAVSPTNPDIIAVSGWVNNSPYEGRVVISKDTGKSWEEVSISGMGGVNSLAFSKNGDKLLLSVNNTEASQGILKKVNVSDLTREITANVGLEGEQNFGGPILSSPNNNETFYAVRGNAPQILKTTDGGQNWTKLIDLPSPPSPDTFRVVNWQGKDLLVVGGTVWVWAQIEGQSPIWDYSQNFATLTIDMAGTEPRILGARYAGDIKVKGLSETNWQEVPLTGLPAGKDDKLAGLEFTTTPDGKKWRTTTVYESSLNGYGFWVYDLSQGETNGTWQQMSNGLEWKDLLPVKRYLPLVTKQSSGGW